MLGWPAAVMETESPSQLMPSEIQRMWTSSTPAGASSTAMRDLLFHVQRLDLQLLTRHDLHVGGAAAAAIQRKAVEAALPSAPPAHAGSGHLFQNQLGAIERRSLGDELECELERRRHHLRRWPTDTVTAAT